MARWERHGDNQFGMHRGCAMTVHGPMSYAGNRAFVSFSAQVAGGGPFRTGWKRSVAAAKKAAIAACRR